MNIMFDRNYISDLGAMVLAKSISGTRITSIELRENCITNEGWKNLETLLDKYDRDFDDNSHHADYGHVTTKWRGGSVAEQSTYADYAGMDQNAYQDDSSQHVLKRPVRHNSRRKDADTGCEDAVGHKHGRCEDENSAYALPVRANSRRKDVEFRDDDDDAVLNHGRYEDGNIGYQCESSLRACSRGTGAMAVSYTSPRHVHRGGDGASQSRYAGHTLDSAADQDANTSAKIKRGNMAGNFDQNSDFDECVYDNVSGQTGTFHRRRGVRQSRAMDGSRRDGDHHPVSAYAYDDDCHDYDNDGHSDESSPQQRATKSNGQSQSRTEDSRLSSPCIPRRGPTSTSGKHNMHHSSNQNSALDPRQRLCTRRIDSETEFDREDSDSYSQPPSRDQYALHAWPLPPSQRGCTSSSSSTATRRTHEDSSSTATRRTHEDSSSTASRRTHEDSSSTATRRTHEDTNNMSVSTHAPSHVSHATSLSGVQTKGASVAPSASNRTIENLPHSTSSHSGPPRSNQFRASSDISRQSHNARVPLQSDCHSINNHGNLALPRDGRALPDPNAPARMRDARGSSIRQDTHQSVSNEHDARNPGAALAGNHARRPCHNQGGEKNAMVEGIVDTVQQVLAGKNKKFLKLAAKILWYCEAPVMAMTRQVRMFVPFMYVCILYIYIYI